MGRASHYDGHKVGVLDSIEKLTRQEGRAPSIRQVALDVDVSVATLHAYLVRLRDEGLIDWIERTHRSLRVRPEARALLQQQSGSNVVALPQRPPSSRPKVSAPKPVVKVDDSIDVGF